MAALLPELGFTDKLEWLPHTIFVRREFVSHHHGFHMLLTPFVHGSEIASEAVKGGSSGDWLGPWVESPYVLGGKALSCVLFGGVVAILNVMMIRMRVGLGWFWLLALGAMPGDFLLRMTYIRAPLPSLLSLLVLLHLLFTRRWIWLGLFGAMYIHVYAGSLVFMPLLVFTFALALLCCDRDWKSAGLASIGCVAAILIGLGTHPYGDGMWEFLKVQLFETGLQVKGSSGGVGREWRPYNIYTWMAMSSFTIAVFLVSLAARFTWNRLFHREIFCLALLNIGCMVLCIWKRRFIEYWPVICLLNSASLWRGFDTELRSIYHELRAMPRLRAVLRRGRPALYVAVLFVAGVSMDRARASATCSFDIKSIRGAMEYLEAYSDEGTILFTDDWDVFPMYFFFNHHNRYVCGLDPKFVETVDPEMWERYRILSRGQAPRRSAIITEDGPKQFRVSMNDIKDVFEAGFVVVDNDHASLYRKMKSDEARFEFVYPSVRNGSAPAKQPPLSIFRVR
jgi:hypothetical protein